MKKYSKGFTLIELLVVIAIIGILSSVVLASLNTARIKARDARRLADLNSLTLALELYANDNSGKYPLANANCAADDHHGLDVLTTGPAPYISKIPTDPTASPNCYTYASGASGVANTNYHMAATLENSASKPANDADCSSIAPLVCFSAALDEGFDGASSAAVYDMRN